MSRVLIVDDEQPIRRALARILTRIDCEVVAAEDGLDARAKLGQTAFDLVITDLFMPRADGFMVLRAVRELQPALPVVILSGHGSATDCMRAMRAGAMDFMSKPVQLAELQRVVRGALQRGTGEDGADACKPDDRGLLPGALMCDSPGLRTMLDQIEHVVDTDAVVLLVGEQYEGKHAIARFLHAIAHPPRGPFVAVACGSQIAGAVELELFGGETDKGMVMAADGGMLFLSDTQNLAPAERNRIFLRLAARRRPDRAGNAPVDVRVVLDVGCSAGGAGDAGDGLAALQHALGAVMIEVPPLREHAHALPLLIAYFVEVAERRLSRRARA